MDTYRYKRLNNKKSQIKLITFLPGTFGREIRIRLKTVVLSESHIPRYQALSYAWGSTENHVNVCIEGVDGGSSLAVTRNLEEALQYLRYSDVRSRVLWIDAICIDQQNIPERSQQVARMGDIFTEAMGVIVWLGAWSDDSTLALKALNSLASEIHVHWPTHVVTPLLGDDDDSWSQEPLPFHSKREIMDSIIWLLDRAWFSRLWIWQEVRLAANGAEIRSGYDSMPWDNFRRAMVCLGTKPMPGEDRIRHGVTQALSIANYSKRTSFWNDILMQTGNCQCSDDRDRIYAILNLIHPYHRSGFEPDYSMSTVEVYKALIIHELRMSLNLILLSHCEPEGNKTRDLPSWVPDFSTPRKSGRNSDLSNTRSSRAYAVVQNESVLMATGCCVGTTCTLAAIPIRHQAWIASEAQQFVKTRLKQDTYIARGSMIEALCRTLCCDNFSERYQPPLPGYPSLKESKEYLLGLMDSGKPNYHPLYPSSVIKAAQGRVFFTTLEGYIGLAPAAAEPQDQVSVLLGCRSPMVLRSDGSNHYKVVGGCYIHGMMEDEAFLGPMYSNWRYVRSYSPRVERDCLVSVNDVTGETRVEDPRLDGVPLPPGWRVASHDCENEYMLFSNDDTGEIDVWYDPRLSPESLKERGVHLQDFALV